ncbi:hypothetical protein VTI28DRAFT_1721 [Corynascus sepedonium]
MPGVDFPATARYSSYHDHRERGFPDYSGETNLAITRRWKNLSRSADTVAKIPNLIWTDLAANAMVGTKSFVGVATDERPLVTVYNKRIRYHLPYAIPAIILLVFMVVTSVSTAFAALIGWASLEKMKRYLNATSVGRIMTATLLDEAPDDLGPAAAWAEQNGNMLVKVRDRRAELMEDSEDDTRDN